VIKDEKEIGKRIKWEKDRVKEKKIRKVNLKGMLL
jgi:hypothetical protein